MLKKHVIVVIAAAALIATVSVAGFLLIGADAAASGAGISGHGLLAMLLGIVGTLLMAGVLLALVMFSNRAGYDDRAGRTDIGD